MANILLGSNDKAAGSTLSDGSWTTLNNLKSTNFGLQAVSTDAQPANTKFRIDLGANYVVRALALANCSLTKNALWRVRLGQASLDIDFSTGVGDARMTSSGGTNGTRFDESGNMVAATAPRYDFDRLAYWNGFGYSDDLTQTAFWLASNARAIDTATVVFGTGAGSILQSGLNVVAGTRYVVTGKVRLAAGADGAFTVSLNDGTLQTSPTITATAKWTKFRAQLTAANTALGVAGAFGAISIGRNSTTGATFQIKNLQVQTLPADRLEVPYRATTTTRIYRCLGLLREEARTNVLLQSSAFDNASWTKTNVTATANAVVGLDGASSAETITPVVTGLTSNRRVDQTFTTTAGGYWTFSTFVKKGTLAGASGNGVALVVQDNTATQNARCNFNLLNNTAGVVSITGTWTNGFAQIDPWGDGWYRLRLTFNVTTAITSLNAQIWLGAFAGSTDSVGTVHLWHAQLEQGSYPSSPIVTTTATVTRSADSVAITGGSFSSWFTTALSGTLYAEWNRRFDSPDAAAQYTIAALSDGSTNNRITFGTDASTDSVSALVVTGAAVQAGLSATGAQTYGATAVRSAVAYQASDFAFCANGGTVQTASSGTVPSVNQLEIGGSPTAVPINGHVRRLAWWPNRFAGSELQSITTSGPGAVDFDSGWTLARLMEFTDDEVPATWAAQYSPMVAFASTTLRYGTVEFLDSAAVALGRLIVCGGFQPATNASYGLKDGRIDLSTSVKSLSGKKYSVARRRLRTADFALEWLTQAEADTLAELHALIGTTDEVLYVPDQDDMAFSQRYGGIGTLSELSPIDFPRPLIRSTAVRWEEKL